MNLKSEDENGTVVSTPTLKLVISYEHQIRKEMVKKMNAGTPIRRALEESRKDVSIKEIPAHADVHQRSDGDATEGAEVQIAAGIPSSQVWRKGQRKQRRPWQRKRKIELRQRRATQEDA